MNGLLAINLAKEPHADDAAARRAVPSFPCLGDVIDRQSGAERPHACPSVVRSRSDRVEPCPGFIGMRRSTAGAPERGRAGGDGGQSRLIHDAQFTAEEYP